MENKIKPTKKIKEKLKKLPSLDDFQINSFSRNLNLLEKYLKLSLNDFKKTNDSKILFSALLVTYKAISAWNRMDKMRKLK